jgi:hypothetical protein
MLLAAVVSSYRLCNAHAALLTSSFLLCCLSHRRLYGIMSLGRFISPLAAPRKSHQLITTGMYSK